MTGCRTVAGRLPAHTSDTSPADTNGPNPLETPTMLPVIDTERLSLRELRLCDGRAMEAFQNTEDHCRLQAVEPEELANGTERIRRYLEHRGPDDARRLFAFAAIEKATGAVVGQVSLSRMMHPAIASLGFGVAAECAGRGFATEMAGPVMAFGFDTVGVNRITAEIAIENAASQRVAEKLGMTRQGVARDCIFAQGRWWTEALYARLAREHRAA